MKKAIQNPIIFISAAVLLSGCTPQDRPLLNPELRAKIFSQNKGQANQGPGAATNSEITEFKIGGYSATAVLLDRQVEALEVIQLATSANKNLKSQYKVGPQEAFDLKEEGLSGYSVVLTADNDSLNYATDHGEFKNVLSKKWKVDVVSKKGQIVSVTAEATAGSEKVEQTNAKKKTALNIREAKATLKLTKVESDKDAEMYELVSTSDSKIDGVLVDFGTQGNLKSTLKFKFAGNELDSNTVKISALSGVISYKPENSEEKSYKILAASDQVTMSGLCNYVTGQVKFKTEKSEKLMNLNEKEVTIEGTPWKITIGNCGSRPSVDFSRLFVW